MIDLIQKIEQAVTVLVDTVHDYAPVAFANSLGAEDMVLTDLIDRHSLDIEMFSLDTGRLPQETYDIPIEQLDLGVRVFNSLKRTGITSVGEVLELLTKGEDTLLTIRNFGDKSLNELKDCLRENGYLEE